MLTRRDVLNQLKIRGVRGVSNLKKECRNLEYHMAVYYDLKILRCGDTEDQPPTAERRTPPPKYSEK